MAGAPILGRESSAVVMGPDTSWAQPERRDVGTRHGAMLARNSIVATIGGELAGFSDVRPDGYLDMMQDRDQLVECPAVSPAVAGVPSEARTRRA